MAGCFATSKHVLKDEYAFQPPEIVQLKAQDGKRSMAA